MTCRATPGIVATHARRGQDRRRAARRLRRQGPGQGRRPRQGRRRQAGQDAGRGLRARVGDPRHADQGTHGQPRPDRARADRSRRSTTSPSCSTAPTAATCASPASRAVWRSRRSPRPTPTPSADPDRPRHRRRRGQGPRDRRGGQFPAELAEQAVETVQALWKTFVEEDATLVEVNPLARLEGDKLEALDGKVSLDENARVPPPRPRGLRGQRGGRPARGQGQGQGPQLRQARRRGRHHRQRRGARHEHPRRRRVRR